MYKKIDRKAIRAGKHYRIRKNISGTAECPRLAVYRSNKHIYAQLIDDVAGNTLAAASTLDPSFEGYGGNKEAAKNLGVPYDTYYGWIQSKRREETPEAFDASGNLSDIEKENLRLQRELRDAKDALEILKKAIGILGK